MIQGIREQSGTPQNPVDRTDPDSWIDARLHGRDAELARRIWEGSDTCASPRHVYGSYLFVDTFDMLAVDDTGKYRLTDFGRAFLEGDPSVERALDEAEGIPESRAIVAVRSPARRSDLLDDWAEFVRRVSNSAADSTVRSTRRTPTAEAVPEAENPRSRPRGCRRCTQGAEHLRAESAHLGYGFHHGQPEPRHGELLRSVVPCMERDSM